ncbi:uncharacterized protein LOC124460161 [Drosophila willistoni]|uniref:uncharacterized protein LOC124460161 n=1 Tax=Drosophila willistoni TaxID=7260 RepID=UPI001F07234D|nr:uncharacterized protein LOC124460161 [Drosophila willistoni]
MLNFHPRKRRNPLTLPSQPRTNGLRSFRNRHLAVLPLESEHHADADDREMSSNETVVDFEPQPNRLTARRIARSASNSSNRGIVGFSVRRRPNNATSPQERETRERDTSQRRTGGQRSRGGRLVQENQTVRRLHRHRIRFSFSHIGIVFAVIQHHQRSVQQSPLTPEANQQLGPEPEPSANPPDPDAILDE